MVRRSRSSLRSRLLALVLLSVAPAWGLALYDAHEEREQARAQVRVEALRLVELTAADEDGLVEGARSLLVALAELPEVRRGDRAACDELFADLLERYPLYANLGVADPSGDVVCSAIPLTQPVTIADRSYFRMAVQARDLSVGDYQIGRITGVPSVNFGYPVLTGAGRLRAVVFAAMDLGWLNGFATRADLPPGATLTVMDRHGTVLARYPDPESWVGRSYPEAPLARILQTGGVGTAEAPGLDGVARLYAFSSLGSSTAASAYVAIGIPTANAFAPADHALARNLLVLSAVAALGFLAAWAGGSAFVLRPIGALLSATKRLASGDLTARSELPAGPSELHQLAGAFDQMAGSLERRTTELEEAEARYRSLVEEIPAVVYIAVPDEGSSTGYVTSYMSPQAEDVLGYPPERFVSDPELWPSLIHPDDRERALAEDARHYETGEPLHREFRVIARDGRVVWLRNEALVVRDQEGRPRYSQGIITDITERKRGEEALQRYARRLESLSEIDRAILTARSPEEVASRALARIKALVPCDRASVLVFDFDAGIGHFLAVDEEEEELGPAAGSTVPLTDLSAPAILRQGPPRYVEDLASVEGRPPILERLFGKGIRSVLTAPLAAEGEIIGELNLSARRRAAFDAEHLEIAQEAADQLAIAIQQARFREELARRAEELEQRLDDLRRTDEQRRRLLASLASAEEEERRRIAGAIHDDPLQKVTAVGLRLELLRRRLTEAEQLEALEQLQQSVGAATARLRNLLFELRPRSLDTGGLADALREYLAQAELDDDIAFRLQDRLTAELPAETRTIAYRSAVEAIRNVVKHARATRAEVLVEDRNDGVLVRVRDDGIGISPGDAERPAPGHLGLTSIRERAEMAGGWSNICGSPGEGTTVEFWLPGR